jgi:putative ABC transport system ATP-binding protein
MSLDASRSIAVACRGVTKDFGAGNALVRALRGVDLDIALGQLTMLVGPSGCGKTTLLSVIAGILHPTGGSVNVLGTDLERLTNGQRVRFRGRNIGFVFQQFNLLPALSAVENVAIPLLLAGWSRARALARGRQLLAQMDMADRADHLPTKLSGGQQQRVAIARAIVHEPRVVVCDEPTSALDARTGHAILELLRRIALDAERAVIVVTHDSRIFEFADRIARMEDGRIAGVEAAAAPLAAPGT